MKHSGFAISAWHGSARTVFLKTLAKHSSGNQDASGTVVRRFWALLILVMALAVTGSAFAVWKTATPFLKEQQQQAIADQAVKDARSIDTMLLQHHMLLNFVAAYPGVVNLALGYEESTDIVDDYLASIARPESQSWIGVYDIAGERVTSRISRPEDIGVFSDAEIEDLTLAIVDSLPGAERRALYRSDGGFGHILFAVPIQNRGFTEGAVATGVRFDLEEVFPGNEIAQKTYLIPTKSESEIGYAPPRNAEVVRLATANLAVVLDPDTNSVAAAGRSLLGTTVSVLTLVLTGAFAVLAWLGRTVIVEPHLRLSAQKQELAELAAVSERAHDAIVVTNIDGKVVWTNPAFEALTGYSAAEIRGRKPGEILQGEDSDPQVIEHLRSAIKNRQAVEAEIMNYQKSGEPYWVSLSITPLVNEANSAYGFMAISRDVTEARRQQDAILAAKMEIERQALQDPLTGLPNRRALDLALKERKESSEPGATVIRIDLDHFKYVNDTLGHEAGDFALNEVARILREETKTEDLPARVGGDEFVLLLEPGATSRDGTVLAERLLKRIKNPKRFEEKTLRFGASFGVASTLDGLLPFEELVIGADSALYSAKDLGRNRVCLYSPELHRQVLDRRTLAREMRLAIANEEFEPHFQAQFDARSRQIVGVETLVRWRSPELGLLYPNAFMPIAQQLSVVEEIDAIIFGKALSQIRALSLDGFDIPKVSFNVTAERIQDEKSYSRVLEHAGEPRIAFEVLESVLVEEQSEVFRFSLDRLRDAGISIEIDDFGSGHASVVGLLTLNPDVMKIDQRLVMPITQSETARGLLKQIIGMAELTGLRVTAEGVETPEHARILTDLGCDTLQGYAFCKPMDIGDLRRFIEGQGVREARTVGH